MTWYTNTSGTPIHAIPVIQAREISEDAAVAAVDRGAHAGGIGDDERREHRRRQKPDKADRACGLGEKRAQVAPLRAAQVYRHNEGSHEEYGKHAGHWPHCGLNSRTNDPERHNTADHEQHERHNLQNAPELARPRTKVTPLGRFKRESTSTPPSGTSRNREAPRAACTG